MKFDCNFLQMLFYKASELVPLEHLASLPNEFWHRLFLKHWPEEEPHLDETINLLGMHYHYKFDKCIPVGKSMYNESWQNTPYITEEEKAMVDKMAQDIHTALVESGNT